MRTHQQIVTDAGTDRLIELFGDKASFRAVRSWRLRNSIPAPYWQTLVDHRIATLEELAACAATRLDRKEAA